MSKRIYSGGTFDLFHMGHVELLKACHALADGGQVVIAVNPDEFVEEFKGRRPVCSLDERMAVLEACRYVDEVIVNRSGADSKPTILAAYPDIIAIGSDWAGRDYCAQMQFTPEWLDGQGIALVYIDRTTGVSSSGIKTRVELG